MQCCIGLIVPHRYISATVFLMNGTALFALKLYEKTASAEREACMSFLPVRFSAECSCPLNDTREPPSVVSTTQSVVLPSASNSLLLPTDQEAIDFPTKTLISVSTTGAIGGLSTEKRKELRF
jgi:hypothetical protein